MNLENRKYYKHLIWAGKVTKVECTNHSYAYTGKMPCTGDRRCIHCGKLDDTARIKKITYDFCNL